MDTKSPKNPSKSKKRPMRTKEELATQSVEAEYGSTGCSIVEKEVENKLRTSLDPLKI